MSADHLESRSGPKGPIGIANRRLHCRAPSPTRVQRRQPHPSVAIPHSDGVRIVRIIRFALNELIYAIRYLATPLSLKASTGFVARRVASIVRPEVR
jgi:hypothetical protein